MTHLTVDTIIVGAGPAGLTAAHDLLHAGQQVALIDDNPQAGGQIWRGLGDARAQRAAAVTTHPRLHWLPHCRVVAAPTSHTLLVETPTQALLISATHIIIATGARERLLPFPGWTTPGVMGIGGLQALAKGGMPIAGKRIVLAGTGPLIWPVAHYLASHGAILSAIIEQQPVSRLLRFGLSLAFSLEKTRQVLTYFSAVWRTPMRFASTVTAVHATRDGLAVSVHTAHTTHTIACDLLGMGYHLVPNLELAQLLGCTTTPTGVVTDAMLRTTQDHIFAIGESRGIAGIDCAIAEAHLAAAVICAGDTRMWQRRVQYERRFATALASAFPVTPPPVADDTIVCRCEDVTHAQLAPFHDWRSAKLQTRCGMGACQGRICGSAVASLYGWQADSVRPPIVNARVDTLAQPVFPEKG
ncbi:MAG: FAD-dependent oxidoreductase [Roseiflexaceae bacterium]